MLTTIFCFGRKSLFRPLLPSSITTTFPPLDLGICDPSRWMLPMGVSSSSLPWELNCTNNSRQLYMLHQKYMACLTALVCIGTQDPVVQLCANKSTLIEWNPLHLECRHIPFRYSPFQATSWMICALDHINLHRK